MRIEEYLAELILTQFESGKVRDIPEEIDVREIVSIAHNNHMDYLLLGSLLRTDNLDEEVKQQARNSVMLSIHRTLVQVSELKELERRFEELGIVNQPMKGARMKFIYPSPEMREMSDIDILIRQDCMEKGERVLSDMGYSLLQSIKHHDIYSKKPYLIIEAHRAMYDRTVDKNQYEYFSDMSKAILEEGKKYTYNFSVDDFYIYMIAHMAKHFYKMGCGIRNLLDIYVYRSKYSDIMNESYISNELGRLGLAQFEGHMHELAFAWMEKREFSDFQRNVFYYMMDSGIYGKDENGIWNKFSEEKRKDQQISIFQLRKWYFFPTISYMSEYYPWLEDYPFLLPIAWAIRAFRGIFMRKGIHKREMLHSIETNQVVIYRDIYQKMGLNFKR